jgi:heme oxygenase
MVSYAYDSIRRRHPLAMFGMVLVLEGTSTSAASAAGRAIRDSLGLTDDAFHYLFSHGELDISHMTFFAELMDTITDTEEQAQIVHSARAFYRLYGAVHDAALRDADHWTDEALEANSCHH